MDFFEAQEHARKRTSRLVVLFGLAVLGTIILTYFAVMLILNWARAGRVYDLSELSWFDVQALAGVAAGTLAVIGFASLYKWSQYRGGGAAVAEGVGARRVNPHTTDLHERRLLDVVEEMAIASGVPVPAVFVLDDEPCINAFAAGLTTSDAVVTVTRGTMEKLSRDELQGVLAHEFSHILNGDMRLNVKIAATVFGILVIGLIGRGVLRGLGQGRVRVRGKGGGGIAVILLIGLLLMIIGYIGYFFGRMIQAAVSRQREFLADASAVQFTRNPGGIAGALRKIGGYALGSDLATHKAAEIGHFFFAEGAPVTLFSGLWATHPPLEARIRAIDPQWDGKYFQPPEVVDVKDESFRRLGYGAPPILPAEALRRAYNLPSGVPARVAAAVAPLAAVAQIGSLTPQHVDHARTLLDATPPRLREAARQPGEAPAVVYAMLAGPAGAPGDPSAALLQAKAGAAAAALVAALRPLVAPLPVEIKLPLAQLTLPTLRQLPPADRAAFTATCQALIAADQQLSCFEFAVQKVLLRHLAVAGAPAAAIVQIYSFNAVAGEIAVVLSALAWAGAMTGPARADGTAEADPAAAAAAFQAGAAQLELIASQLALLPPDACEFPRLDTALDKLATASYPIKQRLLSACAHTAGEDNQIRPEEAELLRATADVLGCPMPPLLGEAPAGPPPAS
ncbi:MAG TPA: M48 family metallopeptidase [Opitutaceae bacterium]|nr:M48 family metallopeptidase [Opitutaceae bacterium]